MGTTPSAHVLTVEVPDTLYDRLAQRAARTQRSVEDEVLDLVFAGVTTADEAQREVTDIAASLALLDDDALWQAARSRISEEAATQLELLHLKRQREGLTSVEDDTAKALVRHFERTVFTRAQAAALLKDRGYDVSPLLHST
jgi:plasmid stability protein